MATGALRAVPNNQDVTYRGEPPEASFSAQIKRQICGFLWFVLGPNSSLLEGRHRDIPPHPTETTCGKEPATTPLTGSSQAGAALL